MEEIEELEAEDALVNKEKEENERKRAENEKRRAELEKRKLSRQQK